MTRNSDHDELFTALDRLADAAWRYVPHYEPAHAVTGCAAKTLHGAAARWRVGHEAPAADVVEGVAADLELAEQLLWRTLPAFPIGAPQRTLLGDLLIHLDDMLRVDTAWCGHREVSVCIPAAELSVMQNSVRCATNRNTAAARSRVDASHLRLIAAEEGQGA